MSARYSTSAPVAESTSAARVLACSPSRGAPAAGTGRSDVGGVPATPVTPVDSWMFAAVTGRPGGRIGRDEEVAGRGHTVQAVASDVQTIDIGDELRCHAVEHGGVPRDDVGDRDEQRRRLARRGGDGLSADRPLQAEGGERRFVGDDRVRHGAGHDRPATDVHVDLATLGIAGLGTGELGEPGHEQVPVVEQVVGGRGSRGDLGVERADLGGQPVRLGGQCRHAADGGGP